MEAHRISVNGLSVDAYYHKDDIESIFIPLLEMLSEKQKEQGRRLDVFLAGPPAMGKSTLGLFLEYLSLSRENLTPAQCVGLDGFHYPNAYLQSHYTIRDGAEVCLRSIKGAPETFNINALGSLLAQKSPIFPIYDRRIHESVPNAVSITKKILLIEGNWLLLNDPPQYRLPCDYSIFLRPEEPETLISRALARKIAGGFDPEAARSFVERSDRYNINYCLCHSRKPDLEILVRSNGRMEVIK